MWCLPFVCFFKQKTAYEVRISDWSSDVCSSDLPVVARLTRPKWEICSVQAGGGLSWERCPPGRTGTSSSSPHTPGMIRSARPGAGTPTDWEREIGRASCRERVCQYV